MVRKHLVLLAIGLGFVIGCANSCRVPLLGRRHRVTEECPCAEQGAMMSSEGPVLIEGAMPPPGAAVTTQPVPAPTPVGPPPRLVPAPATQPMPAQPQPYVPQKRQRNSDG
jgi:hypothetical protein